MTIAEAVGSKREEVQAIARRHGATSLRICGSFTRGEADESSDADVLVDLESLKPRIRDRVLRESVPL